MHRYDISEASPVRYKVSFIRTEIDGPVYWTESLLLGVGMMDRAVTPEQGKLNNQTLIYQFSRKYLHSHVINSLSVA